MNRSEIRARARYDLGGGIFTSPWLYALLVSAVYAGILSVASTLWIVPLIITGPLSIGVYAALLRASREYDQVKIEDMFTRGFADPGRNILLGVMISIFTTLWGLLFIIPGIIKQYSYSMAYFIADDHPEYDWKQCIDASRELMDGHKMDLFLLDCSFIGWYIVGACALGIGVLWVTPYQMMARVNFYREIIGD